jgi:hypothetical protein
MHHYIGVKADTEMSKVISLEREYEKMTDTPNAPYDLVSVLTAANTQNLIFVGRDCAELLAKQADSVVATKQEASLLTIDVVMFPYIINENGQAAIAAGPRRGTFSGSLVSVLLNANKSKGRFVFADGTVIYRDNTILE